MVEIRPASHNILGGITLRWAPLSVARRLFGHQPAVGTLTERLMTHSKGYITTHRSSGTLSRTRSSQILRTPRVALRNRLSANSRWGLERKGGSLGGKPIRNQDRSAYITRQLPRIHRSPRRGLYRRIVGQGSGHRNVLCEGSSDRSPRYCWLNSQRNVQRSTRDVQSPAIQVRGGTASGCSTRSVGTFEDRRVTPRSARRSDGFGRTETT